MPSHVRIITPPQVAENQRLKRENAELKREIAELRAGVAPQHVAAAGNGYGGSHTNADGSSVVILPAGAVRRQTHRNPDGSQVTLMPAAVPRITAGTLPKAGATAHAPVGPHQYATAPSAPARIIEARAEARVEPAIARELDDTEQRFAAIELGDVEQQRGHGGGR